jgi:L-amino acid N-acyltransferase YncA
MIRSATPADAESIIRIYNHYVLNTTITFEEQAISSEEMAGRITEAASSSLPWLVLEQAGLLAGYAYATKWKGRGAYRFSVESTIYLAPGLGGRGLGTQLYQVLLAQLKEKGFHAVIGGIALPNPVSIALHEKFGMTKVAHFKEVGFKLGRWIDVGYWEVVLKGRTFPLRTPST